MLTEYVYRETLVEVLESKDPPFNFTVSLTRGRAYDLKHVLLTKYDAKSILPDYYGLEPEAYATDMQLVADLLWEEIPFGLLHLNLEMDNRPQCSYTADLSFRALCANTALSISLFGSLMLYVSLSLSSAKESKTGEVAKAWIQTAMLFLYACYLTLAVGLVMFFVGLADATELRSPKPYYARKYVFYFLNGCLIPMLLAYFGIGAAAFFRAQAMDGSSDRMWMCPCVRNKATKGTAVHIEATENVAASMLAPSAAHH
jgi:hypothetical protein